MSLHSGSGAGFFNPAAFSVRRWQFTLLGFALLVALGLSSFGSIARLEDPHFKFPLVVVVASYPGVDPAQIENLVAKPLEDTLGGIEDLDEVFSSIQDGSVVVTAQFTWGVDPERKYDEVVREVNSIRGSLPAGLARLEIRKIGPDGTNIRQVALVSDNLPWRQLEKIADRLRERIDRVDGVNETEYWGGPQSEVRVAIDLGRLASLNLPITAVSDALRAEGLDIPIGAIQAGERRFNVKTDGAFETIDAVGTVPVRSVGGRVVRVRDVATVSWETKEATHLTFFNGKRAMFVSASGKTGVDVIKINERLDAAFDEFEKTLPADVKLERGFQQSKNVEYRLSKLYRDFAIALGLVLITLLPLGFRASLVVMLSIPLSLLMGITALYWLGYSLNQLSIAGFVLALGLLVDDSIVVTENIARRLREGEDRTDAAVNATGQIGVAVLGCTATLMLAFLPLLFLPEGAGQFIRSLPMAVLVTIAASLFVSLTIIPFLASILLKRDADLEGNFFLRNLNRGIHNFYRPILHFSLERPWIALIVVLAICATAVPMLRQIGSSLFPPAGTPQFLVKIEMQDGTSLARTGETLRLVDEKLRKEPLVEWTMANLGRGNPRIFYNQNQSEARANSAEIFVQMKRWERVEGLAFLDKLRTDFEKIPGAKIRVIVFENGPPVEAPIAVRIVGRDMDVLKQLSAQATAIMGQVPGTRDIDDPLRLDRTDLNLGVDHEKAATLGVPAGVPRRIARLALTGDEAARFRDSLGDEYPVTVRLPVGDRNDIAALQSIYVPTSNGAAIPLSQIATPQLESSPARITRFQRERQVTVTSYTGTGFLTSAVNAAVFEKLNQELKLPPGYRISAGGEADAASSSFSGLGGAILIAIFGILAVLTLEFGKYRTVLVVAGVVPLGLFGAVGALWLTGNSLSFTAVIGIIALIGIEIKNSILLVDFTEQLRREGAELSEAIERAGEIRFVPVFLTSLTAIGGLIPLALEDSGLYSPLAIAIIGGLVTSTFLSRIATPVMYLLVARTEKAAKSPTPEPVAA